MKQGKPSISKLKRAMPKVTGHRGAAGLEPENTMSAFERAIKLGVDAIEMDVHLTKDNRIAIMHDTKVDRTTDGHGYIRDLTLEQIKKFDVGKGESVPTLDEVLEMAYGKVGFEIELKGAGTEIAVPRLLAKYDPNDFCIISYWHDKLLRVKELSPKLMTGVILDGLPVNILDVMDAAKSERLSIKHNLIDKPIVDMTLVDLLHKHGKTITAGWALEDVESIKDAIGLSVDTITSNRPDIVLEVLGRKK